MFWQREIFAAIDHQIRVAQLEGRHFADFPATAGRSDLGIRAEFLRNSLSRWFKRGRRLQ
jgi:hypothetical protein